MKVFWKALIPFTVALLIALIPVPTGLAQHAWYYFAIFAGVVIALILEPIPGAAIGLIAITLVTVLSEWAFFSPEQLVQPGFSAANASLKWALSGFSNSTVWLIFSAFMFALGYEKTGLGKRIALLLVRSMGRKTLTLGYAVMVADVLLAPFTPSNTARSGGTIFPVIRNLPPLYASEPNDSSARRMGSYIMWTAIATTCVTSSMFLTGLAPNLLAIELIRKTAHIELNWVQWFLAFAPTGIVLLITIPLLTYIFYPPEIKQSFAVPAWAEEKLQQMGKLTQRELLLGMLVLLALVLWIFGGGYVNATTAALLVISLMLVTKIMTWGEMLANKQAWNTFTWFATLVVLADGLSTTGFVEWFADIMAIHMSGFSPTLAVVALALFFFSRTTYLLASRPIQQRCSQLC